MILQWLLKHWKTIKLAFIRKDGCIYQIIATRKTLHRMYKDGVIDEWQANISEEGDLK